MLKAPTPGSDSIAPPWHTLLLAVAILAVSAHGFGQHAHSAMASHHLREYSLTLAYEWVLAGIVMWGLYLRRTPLQTLLGSAPSTAHAWFLDAGIALAFWFASSIVLGAVAVLLKYAHVALPQSTLAALAPQNAAELLLFLLLSLSAGFCEELLFRGYFEKQFGSLTGGRIWVSMAASALLFGCAHLYEGLAGVIAITIFGLMFSLLALERRSLRPGMMAHAWHDALSGFLLYIMRHAHLIS